MRGCGFGSETTVRTLARAVRVREERRLFGEITAE